MPSSVSIVWFRQDLRLQDNPALSAACQAENVLPIYILDDESAGEQRMGGASRWWLHHSLSALNDSLDGALNLYVGDAQQIILELCERFGANTVYWSRCYEPANIAQTTQIKQQLQKQGITGHSINGCLINEPWEVTKQDGTAYKIFTPYHREACKVDPHINLLAAPNLAAKTMTDPKAKALDELTLLPKEQWDTGFKEHWQPGEKGAKNALNAFLSQGIHDYKDGRDRPALKAISRLSPHLHFGDISPRQVIDALKTMEDNDNVEHFKREIRWREFSYYLLYHFPGLPTQNLKTNFDQFPWGNNAEFIKRWQQGQTGYPMVDAGMRELWQTGYMHNRVRMITASFLIKNLLVDWRVGAQWFWDCLVDADLASNSASWQWVAGCGTDASPYFRIFNPITQGEKFDPKGEYTRHFVPELKDLPDKYLYRPWEAPEAVLKAAKVSLGTNYPNPIIDVKTSRLKALDAYQMTKGSVTHDLA